MSDKYAKGKRNLLILSWMGLVCQGVGVPMSIGLLFWKPAAASAGFLLVVFGMALGGWAGNYSEIIDLKKRVAELEAGKATPPVG